MIAKIAFLFLTITLGQSKKAWRLFFKEQESRCSVYIHDNLPAYQKTLHVGKNGAKVTSKWSSLMQSGTQLLKEALKDASNEKFVFLAETALPSQSFDAIYEDITAQGRPVFDYVPSSKGSNKGARTVVHWVVLDRDHAQLMTQNDGHLKTLLQPYVDKNYPSTFSNLLSVVKQTALTLEKEIGLESLKKPEVAKLTAHEAQQEEKRVPVPFDPVKYSVDFEISMGKYDLYLKPFYEKCLLESLDYWKQSVSMEPPRYFFNFLKTLYEDNKLSKITPDETYRIPPVIHHIWIGEKPFPEKYKSWQKTWQSIPGWRYKLWTDKEVENFPLINKDLYYSEKNIGARADILRMEILYREGGLYVDTDFECLQPELFDIFNRCYDFYAGITPLDGQAYLIANGLIAAKAGHPIIRAYIEERRHLVTPKTCTGVVMKGPGFLTRLVYMHANRGHRDILFPSSFFYALPIYPPKEKGLLSDKQGHLAHLMDTEEGREEIKRLVNKPESVAIHWWEGAWVLVDGKPIC